MKKKKGLDRRIGSVLRAILLAPFAGPLAVAGFRLAQVSNPGRIGHLATEVDAFLKERELGLIPDDHPILLLERKRAGNAALLDTYRQYMTVWDKRWQKLVFTPFTKFAAFHMHLGRPVLGFAEAARYAQINTLWGDRPPAVKLTQDVLDKGAAQLRKMGVPDGAWFVAAHVREAGYSPGDEHNHAHRNADISTFDAAFRAITDAGGWVIRMGDPTMTPLPETEQVIDYATSEYKSDWMDLYLCAKTHFVLGTTSGLQLVAVMFGRPAALANMIPHGAVLGMGANDISIPKSLMRDGQILPLPQIFREGLSVQRYASVFDDAGVTIVPNTSVEIEALVREMMARLDGTFETTDDDEVLQNKFHALLGPADYSFGSSARVGRDWLRENRHLLEG